MNEPGKNKISRAFIGDARGEAIPPLEQVSGRIEEILLQQQVNVLFDQWLTNLRKQGDVEVLDPALAGPDTQSAPESGVMNTPAGTKP